MASRVPLTYVFRYSQIGVLMNLKLINKLYLIARSPSRTFYNANLIHPTLIYFVLTNVSRKLFWRWFISICMKAGLLNPSNEAAKDRAGHYQLYCIIGWMFLHCKWEKHLNKMIIQKNTIVCKIDTFAVLTTQ